MVACGLEPARSLRKKDAQAIWDAFSANRFTTTPPWPASSTTWCPSNTRPTSAAWGRRPRPRSPHTSDSDDEARVLDYLRETCRASWKKRAS